MDQVAVSKYLSYLLRHDSKELEMDRNGFVPIIQILGELTKRFPYVNRDFLENLVNIENSRFQIKQHKIRALYGHSLYVKIELEPAKDVRILYHGTTKQAAQSILKDGLNPKSRRKVHLSATREEAIRVGKRRTSQPVILRIDVVNAQKNGINIQKATDNVYLADRVPPQFISKKKHEKQAV